MAASPLSGRCDRFAHIITAARPLEDVAVGIAHVPAIRNVQDSRHRGDRCGDRRSRASTLRRTTVNRRGQALETLAPTRAAARRWR